MGVALEDIHGRKGKTGCRKAVRWVGQGKLLGCFCAMETYFQIYKKLLEQSCGWPHIFWRGGWLWFQPLLISEALVKGREGIPQWEELCTAGAGWAEARLGVSPFHAVVCLSSLSQLWAKWFLLPLLLALLLAVLLFWYHLLFSHILACKNPSLLFFCQLVHAFSS